eukprot:gnl/MRDRNA2_/MRDRNA2_30626_c0_seq1.p1 gnl/MRDRNA2_/MRDRNA2_30626_c0~~gnl/MRDRNA2_/MRDRNA2_30626_c0_seq1.p1  ORF type:complete len:333 (-),score=57.67 gnl/MRDRNA2_/MRDRNA2_30626_c0_seq1:281-1246(-)
MTDHKIFLGDGGLVEYRPSLSWPVVLSVPHGGDLTPEDIPDRTSGCTETDWNSWELAEEVCNAFCQDAAGPPAMIGLRLSRQKMDANRARTPSCERSEVALKAWDEYHGWLAQATESCCRQFGFCLLLDLHGQSHRAGVTELGYLITSDDLLLADEVLDAVPPRPSSMDAFIGKSNAESPGLSAIIRGNTSLGALLEVQGFRCTPSPSIPQPVAADVLKAARQTQADIHGKSAPPSKGAAAAATYFWGAYTARRYGAPRTVPEQFNPLPLDAQQSWANKVAAVQMETSWEGVRVDAASRQRFGDAILFPMKPIIRLKIPNR